MHCTRFRIVRAIYQAANACMHQRTRAHRARLNRNEQVAAFQTIVTNGGTGFAQSEDLGMGGWIALRDVAIPSAAYDLAIAYHDRAYRDLPCF